ncbi:hypothetical protein ACQPZJ_42070 [Actinoplanes sp. CA-054009]
MTDFEDRIVAEYGDGYDVEGIAARYGLTVAQVYAVVQQALGPAAPPPGPYPPQPYAPPGPYPPPAYYAPQPYAPQPYAPQPYGPPPGVVGWVPNVIDEDAVVAAYGDGHDVEAIAHRHGITPEQVYQVVQRALSDG